MTSEKRFRLKAGMTSAEEAGMTSGTTWKDNNNENYEIMIVMSFWRKPESQKSRDKGRFRIKTGMTAFRRVVWGANSNHRTESPVLTFVSDNIRWIK